MEQKVEELNIELYPELKQRGKFEFASLDSMLISTEEMENVELLSIKKKIYYCSSELHEAKFISNLEWHRILKRLLSILCQSCSSHSKS